MSTNLHNRTGVRDPALIVVYFFSGVEEHENVVRERLRAISDKLAQELHTSEPFTPCMHRADLRYLHFHNYRWDPEGLAMLAQFDFKPSQVCCIQLALPLHKGLVSWEQALSAWQNMERQLDEWLGDWITQARPSEGLENVYWGSSRLYWALSDNVAGRQAHSLELAQGLQSIACPPEISLDDHSPVRPQTYVPQDHQGDYGTLWRLDEPAASDGAYQAAWLLLSPQAQNDQVATDYIFNCRFAVGEVYLCKAHNQAGEYGRMARNLKGGIRAVQDEAASALNWDGPPSFAPDQIAQAQGGLRSYEERLHQVAVVYSRLLLMLAVIDRLHLTVKTNLENYQQMASEFQLWDHPACQHEIARLRGVLKQIEHDQHSRGASLQSFQTAMETVRARLDLMGERLAAAHLEIEQAKAERLERWNVVVAILGVVLGMSQLVVLNWTQFQVTLLSSAAISLFLILLLWRLRYSASRTQMNADER